MREDFVSRLGTQLFEAAEREERRGRAGRAAGAVRWSATSPPVLAACGLLLALVIAVAAGTALRGDDPPAVTNPRVVERMQLVQTGGVVAPGSGAVWAVDSGTGRLLRVDARTRRVTARISIEGQASVNVIGGVVWALDNNGVLRIDPATNRVTARIPAPPARGPAVSGVLPGRGALWVPTSTELLRVDPDRERIDKRIPLSTGGFLAATATADGTTVYVGRSDGSLLRFDGRTGNELPRGRLPVPGFVFGAADGVAFIGSDQGVGAFDPGSGRTVWRRELPVRTIDNAVLWRDTVWVHGTDARSGRDRLWRLDARTGAVRGSVAMREFGAPGLAPVGNEVWVVSGSGVLTVVR